MTLEEVIREKIKRLESVPKGYTDSVKKLQPEILTFLLTELEGLKRDSDGNLKMTKANLLVIEDVMDEFRKYFNQSDYIELTKVFVNEFSEQATLNDTFFRKSFKEFESPTSFALAALNRSKQTAYELLASNATVTVNLYTPIEQVITNAVMAGDSYKDLTQAIKNTVLGKRKDKSTPATDGKLYKYAQQIAYDAFTIADAGYTEQIANDLGVDWFAYRGGLVEDSRPFCIERNGKYFHRKEVEAWGNLKTDWKGRMPNTNDKTIFRFRGGFSCAHILLPTSLFNVPKEVVLRNEKNGNYTP